MIDKFYETFENIIGDIVKWWDTKRLRRKILSYKKILNGRIEKQSSSDTQK